MTATATASITRDGYEWIKAADAASLAADYESQAYSCAPYDMGSVQVNWVGSDATTGLIIPEASIDGDNWCSLFPLSAIGKTSVGAGCFLYILPNVEYPYIRVRIEHGTVTAGTITAWIFLKRRRSNNP